MFGLRWLDGMAVIVAVAMAPTSLGGGAPLTIKISGLDPNTGQVFASIYDRADRFPTAPFAKKTFAVGEAAEMEVTFTGLTRGDYAVTVVYDRDLNGALTFGELGLPQEPFSFSNNVNGPLTPEGFAPAAIEVGDIPVTHGITLHTADMQPDQPLRRIPVAAPIAENPKTDQKAGGSVANDFRNMDPDAVLDLGLGKEPEDGERENKTRTRSGDDSR